jgi:cob(I)alamin adenosyltransferase
MKIYTKTGDKGETSLFGGTRVPKYHLRIEAYGTIDELNSYIGLIRDQQIDSHTEKVLLTIQNKLFTLGAMLATPPEKELLKSGKERLNINKVDESSVVLLENEIDFMNESLPPMTHFVLPGGHTTVSFCHIARCICRRAERIATQLNDESEINEQILIYLNRLSDYLFVLARKLTYDNNAKEIQWIPEKNK